MARIPLVEPEADPDIFAFLREKRGEASTFNIFRAMANVPDILRPFIEMADAVRAGYGIDPGLRELAIVQACQILGSRYEHDRHWNMALGLGVPKEKLEKLWDFEASDLFEPVEKAALRLARDASRAPSQVSASIWQDVSSYLGDQQALALLFSIAWYNLTARISEVLEIEDEPNFARR